MHPVRVLYLPVGMPAVTTTVVPSEDGFAGLLGGQAAVIPITKDYALVCRRADRSDRPNLSVSDLPGQGFLSGPMFAIQSIPQLGVVDMDDGSLAALRGYLEARRVGAC